MISANAFFAPESFAKVKASNFLFGKISKSILGKKGVVPLEYFASFDDARVLDGRHEIIGVGLKMIIFVLDRKNLEFGVWKSRILQ